MEPADYASTGGYVVADVLCAGEPGWSIAAGGQPLLVRGEAARRAGEAARHGIVAFVPGKLPALRGDGHCLAMGLPLGHVGLPVPCETAS